MASLNLSYFALESLYRGRNYNPDPNYAHRLIAISLSRPWALYVSTNVDSEEAHDAHA